MADTENNTKKTENTKKKVKITNKTDKPDNVVEREHQIEEECSKLEAELPPFLRGFFSYMRSSLLPMSRLAYLHDIRFFCNYLITNRCSCQ